MGGSVCTNTRTNTTAALVWTVGAQRGFSARSSLIKLTEFVLVRFSRENKHFPTLTGSSGGAGGKVGWRCRGLGPCWHKHKLWCGGVGKVTIIEQPCLTLDKVRVDKSKDIHRPTEASCPRDRVLADTVPQVNTLTLDGFGNVGTHANLKASFIPISSNFS